LKSKRKFEHCQDSRPRLRESTQRDSELTSQLGKNTDLLIESRVKKEVSNFKLVLMEQEVQELEVQLRMA